MTLYPVISNYVNAKYASEIHTAYEEVIEQADNSALLEAKELAKAVGRFLDTLPFADKSVFLKRYYYLASTQDIAEELRMSPGKVKSMLHRTRGKLRLYLEKEGYC